jgi:C4-dicarboxylate-specific signal transduction histidine kinase
VQEKTKHLEEALIQLKSTQAELVQSARLASLGTLSAGIAHEINNSINYVNGALGPLEKKVHKLVPPEERAMIDKLFAAIKEGTSLTVDIVRSLRNFTGLNQAEYKSVDLSQVVHSVLTILKNKAKDVSVKVTFPENPSIMGNITGLNQIFMNLISNSLDAMDKEEKTITINCQDLGNKISIVVEDNGSGIPKAVIDRIFDPFFTTKDVGQGTGLGLHIVAKEIEKHGGKISVQSFEGKGTRFDIELSKGSESFEQGRAA